MVNPFRDKKIVVMGLGLLGGALNDTIFLAEHGADLLVTDMKSEDELKASLDKLKEYKNIKYALGGHRLEDFQNADLILQPGNVPLDSPYLAEARKNNIPIYVSESLFAQYCPEGVKLVGVTGTRGKSTTTQLIYNILVTYTEGRSLGSPKDRPSVFLAGNVKNVSTLALLNEVKAGDTVVMELDSWALHGMGDIKKSPNVAVFTNLMTDHQNFYHSMDAYFADKANIFLYQKPGDEFICGPEVLQKIQDKYPNFSGRAIVPDAGVVPADWKIKLLGEHNWQNIAFAVTAARVLDVPEEHIKAVVEGYAGVPGRLELVAEKAGVRYYNDTTATTPEASLAALNALQTSLKEGAGIVLIAGGSDKMLDFSDYVKKVPQMVKNLILLKGTATEKILGECRMKNVECGIEMQSNGLSIVVVDSMEDAVKFAQGYAKKGDIVLLSPGAASFGLFKNEFDRGEQFNKFINSI